MSNRSIIGIDKGWSWKRFFLQWEWLLVLILLIVFAVNAMISPYFLTVYSLVQTPSTFLDKAFIVFPMTLVIVLGRIDVSVGSTAALSAVVMAVGYNAGLSMPWAMLLCLVVGAACGGVNGLLLIRFKELSHVIVTLATMIIYRGIAYIILGDQASGGFPDWYSFLGWGSVAGIPFILIVFVLAAVVFGLVLHKTRFGRSVYGMGFNTTTCEYSGLRSNRITLIIFTMAGLMSAVTALFLSSRMGSTRPNVAAGFELEVITMAVLGGVSTSGGIGRIGGPVLAVFIIGYLSYGMGLANIQAPVVLIVIGSLLILSVLAMKLKDIPGKRKSTV